MGSDSPVDRAIAGIADGAPLDWNALVAEARSDEEREQLQCLRLIADLAELHRSTPDPSEEFEDCTPEPAVPVSGQPPDDLPKWGKYTLLEKIGEGSFGEVFRARDPDLEWDIAIKILRRDVILPEARALALVRHPNVVSVYGVEAHGDELGLCMEFVRGETLEAERQRRGKLGEREARLIGEDVCRALAAVHAVGVVHRDVKARNVMRDHTGRMVLMDFGTVCLDGASGVAAAGTPMYMAPEILLSNAPATVASDVYSVGVLLYYLVTGAYPVEADSVELLKAAHRAGRRRLLIDRRPDLPMSFVQVVERALAADPRQRYASAGALLSALSFPRGRTRYLVASAVVAASLAGGLTFLGVLSTRYLNATLGRSDFADETIGDWFRWGAMSALAPAVLCMFALAGIAILLACRRGLLAVSATACRVERAVFEVAHRLHLDNVAAMSSAALLLSTVVLSTVWWYFAPLLGALVSISPDISTAPAESLGLLSPHFRPYHETYRASFIWVTIVCVVLWYPAVRLATLQGERPSSGIVAGGVAVVLLALALLDFPYRLLYHSKFEAAIWQGSPCFVLGERKEEVLLFCPESQVPRNLTVKNSAPGLVRRGVKENIFAHFAPHDGGQP